METLPQHQGFGLFKVLLSRILSPYTFSELAVCLEFPHYTTFTDRPLSSLRFVEDLHRQNVISPKSIKKLTKTLVQIGYLGEKEKVEKAFAEYRQAQVLKDEAMLTGDGEVHTVEDSDDEKLLDDEMSTGSCDDDVSTEDKDDKGSEDGEESFAENNGADLHLHAEWCKVKAIRIPDGRVTDNVNAGDDTGAHFAAVCVILEISESGPGWSDCIGRPVGLYLYEHKYGFQKDKFYRLKQFRMTRRDDGLELLVSRNCRISEISHQLLKNTNYEHNIEDVSTLSFPSFIHLSTSLTVKEACEIRQRRSISSIRGVVFEVKYKTDRTTFQLSDDGETSVTVVAPYDKCDSEDINEKDIVELRFLEAIPERKKMKYLLFDNDTELTHLGESDQRLVRLLNCELVNRSSRLEGTVVECGEAEYYVACKNCFQKKLSKIRRGMYGCFKCRKTFKERKDVTICFTVYLKIQGPSVDDEWEGITFANIVKEILEAGYPDEPSKRNENALGNLLVNKNVEFTRKKCDPPLNDVFSNFKFL